jgi:sialate O-acetylesterase
LKGFAKLDLRLGENKQGRQKLDRRFFSFYERKKRNWHAEPGDLERRRTFPLSRRGGRVFPLQRVHWYRRFRRVRITGPMLFVALFVGISLPCRADPVLPHLIGDHMVLQRGQEIHIWGAADPGERIAIALAGNTAASRADANGQWSLKLPAMPAGGPFTLTIRGKKQITLKDVMIGEVWIASGQSNMTFALNGSTGASEEIPKADYPQIRFFTVPKKIARDPQSDTLPAAWQICTPDTAKDFSAVSYYFARHLHRELNVAIGVVESAWPGTTIEEWIEPGALRVASPAKADHSDSASAASGSATEPTPFALQFDDFELLRDPSVSPKPEMLSTFEGATSRTSTGGYWSYDWQSAPDTSFDIVSPGRGGTGFAAQVGGRLDGSDDSRLLARFHVDGSPVDLSAYSGIRFWVRGQGSVRLRVLQPTISDWDDYSGSVLQATSDWKPVTILFRDLRQEGWGVSKDFTPTAVSGLAIECLTATGYPPRPRSGLYQGMITPLLAYGFRGAIWYQGESNALQAHQYRKLLPALIESWRHAAHQPWSFLIVELPNHGAIPDQPSESAWAELREAQLLASEQIPDVGLAVTIDVGEPKDVHPHRKAEVGQRLALWALGTTYKEPIVYSGPLYRSMEVQGSQIKVRFTNIGSGLMASGTVQGFAIAGADQKFHWAEATIEGDAVEVSSTEVPDPVAVRYAWGDSPICNLYNKEGLPASPFRTDDWPGITGP